MVNTTCNNLGLKMQAAYPVKAMKRPPGISGRLHTFVTCNMRQSLLLQESDASTPELT